jgi:serine/threonine protein kinase
MGEVYRARDSKLKREVAIKVLPALFSHDVDRVARFQREAELLAALNHPHIAGIYDVVEFEQSRFLVLELVEGETLAERIARGPIPLSESLVIARQVAEALEAAHEKGIVHRDLKPANIKIGSDGNVKVLDFGLAKASDPSAGISLEDFSNSPTLMSGTTPGMILGTAAYMSPEQAKGKTADRTTDVWAFGCVLFEMLSGRKTFDGETVGEILGAVFRAEPDWRQLPPDTPRSIRRLLRRCLQKDRKARIHDIADARLEIEEARNVQPEDIDAVSFPSTRTSRVVWLAAVVLLILIASAIGVWRFPSPPLAPEVRLEITTPPTADLFSLAISPDGRSIVFSGISEGRPRLWLRSLDSLVMRPLEGTDFASYPFWKPDSRSIGFFADGKIKRIDLSGGLPQVLANASNARGGTWSGKGTILFSSAGAGSILRIPETGGEPFRLTQLGQQQVSHRFPSILPGGDHFLFYTLGRPEVSGIYVASIDGSKVERLLDADTAARYAPTGQLLFVKQGTLFAQDFDVTRRTLSGEPFPVAEQQIARDPLSIQYAALSISEAGPIVYRTGSTGVPRQMTWFDRSGNELQRIGAPETTSMNAVVSADGRRVVIDRTVQGNVDIWVVDLERGGMNRITSGPSIDAYPILSPDGNRIVFGAIRKAAMDLFTKSASGAEDEMLLLEDLQSKSPTDWSRDGRFILYRSSDPTTGYDIWALPVEKGGTPGKPVPIVRTAFEERDAQFSPDGKWIAYESNESNRFEIYVQQFPTAKAKIPISTNGGEQVRWAPNGKELFYIALDGRLMSVPIRIAPDGQSIDPGAPTPLFSTRVGGASQGASRQQYMISPDGQRFLMNTLVQDSVAPITVILNWRGKRPLR